MEEMANDVAKGAGLKMAASAIGLANHKQMLDSHARRLEDSHRAQLKAAGLVPDFEPTNAESEDVPGDVNVTGDSWNYYQQATPAKKNNLATAALVAAGLASAGGVGGLATWLLNRQPAPTPPAVTPIDTDTDTHYELRISSGDELPQ